MSADKELSYSDVAEHNTKKDLYVVIHDTVYNASTFVDEHPGGEEVLMDVGGQDATEAFEDVGHSDEAREILAGLAIGKLTRQPGDPSPKSVSQSYPPTHSGTTSSTGLGAGLYVIILVGGALAFGAYKYLEANKEKV